MALSIFTDNSHAPQQAELENVLGDAAQNWNALVAHVTDGYAPIIESWRHGGASYGWSLRLKKKDRAVVYMTPQEGAFLVAIVLGEKAVGIALGLGLPPAIAALIEAAPRYAEGRGIRMTINASDSLEGIMKMVDAKMRK